jgi:hypothetical protein
MSDLTKASAEPKIKRKYAKKTKDDEQKTEQQTKPKEEQTNTKEEQKEEQKEDKIPSKKNFDAYLKSVMSSYELLHSYKAFVQDNLEILNNEYDRIDNPIVREVVKDLIITSNEYSALLKKVFEKFMIELEKEKEEKEKEKEKEKGK